MENDENEDVLIHSYFELFIEKFACRLVADFIGLLPWNESKSLFFSLIKQICVDTKSVDAR